MQGNALACTYLVNLDTDKIYFRTSSDTESSEGSEDECETPSKGGPEYAEPEGVEQKMQEALRAAVPSSSLFREDGFPLPPLPPPPLLTTGAAQAFPSL